MNKLNIQKYDASFQRLASYFNSGNIYLDNFIKESTALDDSYGKTFIWLSSDEDKIIGYYNIGTGYISEYYNNQYFKIGGSIHINAFALDKKYRGLEQGVYSNQYKYFLSDFLLDDCLERIENLRKNYIGFTFVTLSSTQEGYNLYKRNGFEELDEDMHFSIFESDKHCIPMYLALDIENEI